MPTNLQARYDLSCVKSAVKPQPTNQPDSEICTHWKYNLTHFRRHVKYLLFLGDRSFVVMELMQIAMTLFFLVLHFHRPRVVWLF